MKTCLVVNERSGSWQRHAHLLRRLAAETDCPIFTESEDEPLSHLLTSARRCGFQRLVVAGGDGTLSRVVNAGFPYLADFELALVPTGTGNDLARSLGIHGTPLEQAWEWAASKASHSIDVVKVTNGTTRYLVNGAAAGFGGIVSTDVTSDDKQRWGAVAYWMTAFSRLAALQEFDLQLELDETEIELKTFGLAIANGRYVGGGFPVAPTAMLNDGMLDVTTVPVLSTLELLAAGVDFVLERHHRTERVRTYRSSRVRIRAKPTLPYSLDGEPTRAIDATFEVVRDALHMVCGARPEAVQTDESQRQAVA